MLNKVYQLLWNYHFNKISFSKISHSLCFSVIIIPSIFWIIFNTILAKIVNLFPLHKKLKDGKWSTVYLNFYEYTLDYLF